MTHEGVRAHVLCQHTANINFDNNRRMRIPFEEHQELKRIIAALQIEPGVKITPEDALIAFNVVQEAPRR